MIRALVEQTFDQHKKYFVLAGTSSDSKPASGLITGSEFHEVDTGLKYQFDEASATWNAVGLTPDEIKAEIDAWLDDHPEATTTVEDGAITYAKLNSSLQGTVDEVGDLKSAVENDCAMNDGSYPDLTSGSADQLLSTTGVTDKVPYTFRASGGNGADREIDKIVGGTVCWNQLVQFTAGTETNNDVTFTRNADGTVTLSGTATAYTNTNIGGTITGRTGHKILVTGCPANRPSYSFNARDGYTDGDNYKDYGAGAIFTAKENMIYQIQVNSGFNTTGYKFTPQFYDLTAMFGSTIADYIYSLETATAGAGIALLKSWGFFTAPYYAYNVGELMSVNAARHETVGFNQWDEEWEVGGIGYSTGENEDYSSRIRSKNYIPIKNWETYCFTYYGAIVSTYGLITVYYDKNKNYIEGAWRGNQYSPFTVPSNACYMRFCTGDTYGGTYKNDICINISNTALNGTYQPYQKHTYALDSDLTLRGIPKLDSNNRLYYDGDTYASDGTVTRRYGIVNLGAVNWGKYSVTQGTLFRSVDLPNCGLGYDSINMVCSKYPTITASTRTEKTLSCGSNTRVDIIDSSYDDTAAFKAAMSGVYFVYELATPTTETADPFQSPQIVDPYGTEEYVDAGVVAETRDVSIPVGHETFYPENLRSKIEGLPTNFTTLIAPTETSYKATQNYTSGALFIVNNILYKATANIANGGTITPGTNCNATTLAAVIAALA